MHAQDWDEHAIAMLDRCPSDKCFLSHYPPATGDPGLQVPVLCMSHFDEGAQMPSFEARNFDLQVRPPAPSFHATRRSGEKNFYWGALWSGPLATSLQRLVVAGECGVALFNDPK